MTENKDNNMYDIKTGTILASGLGFDTGDPDKKTPKSRIDYLRQKAGKAFKTIEKKTEK